MVDRAYDLIVSILCAARFDDGGYVLSADEARPLARRCADALAQDRGAIPADGTAREASDG